MTCDVQMSDRSAPGPPGRGGAEVRSPDRRLARTAGVAYLLMALGTAFGMGYVDPRLRAAADGGAVVDALRSSEALFLAGSAGTALGLVAMLFLANALHGLLEGVDRGQARLLATFVAVGVGIALLNLGNALVAIRLSGEGGLPAALDPLQREALVTAFLRAYRHGGAVATLFWGLWMLPFGRLLLRSGFAPRALGFLMAAGCVPYLVHGAVLLFLPAWADVTQRTLAMPTVAELWAIGWLFAKGWGRGGSG